MKRLRLPTCPVCGCAPLVALQSGFILCEHCCHRWYAHPREGKQPHRDRGEKQ